MSSDRGKTAAYRVAQTMTCNRELVHPAWASDKMAYRGDKDEKRLEDLDVLGEQVEAEVDEDKILRQLREDGEHVLRGALGTARHRVVRVVLEGDTTEEEGNNACAEIVSSLFRNKTLGSQRTTHVHPVGEKVACVGDQCHETGFDAGVVAEA